MTTDTRCNGWTNYATWLINLEIFDGTTFVDGTTFEDICGASKTEELADDFDANVVAKQLKDYVNERQFVRIALNHSLAFVPNVNWYEIAENLIIRHKFNVPYWMK